VPHDKLNIAVLISGAGTTLQNFINLARSGALPVNLRLVISSRPGAKGLERAVAAGVPTEVISRGPGAEDLFSQRVTQALSRAQVDLVCMAGFLRMWIVPPEFENRVMNIHPALLPGFGGKGFYGQRVHQAVLDAGCKVSGASVHFADNIYDHGPIILQKAVSVREDDTASTLARRVHRAERLIYPQAVRLFAEGRLRVDGRRVHVLPE
jgi:formyltetrahydrofolate-dependent phosphoribosylglycinamide formyltransferase